MKTYLKCLALAVLAISACSKEAQKPEVSTPKEPLILKANFAQTRSTVTDEGDFGWSANDAISVYTGIGEGNNITWSFVEYTLQSGAGTSDAEFIGADSDANIDKVAVFPSSLAPALNVDALTVTLPAVYMYVEGETNVPMIAQVTDGVNTDLSFKHLAGLLKLTVNNVPEEANRLLFMVPGKKITGEFTVADYTANGACIETEDGEDNYITISFNPTGESMTFYIPLPVGEYPDGFLFTFFDSRNDMCSIPIEYTNSFSVERADLLLAPEQDTWIIDNGYYMLPYYDGTEEDEEGVWVQNLSFLIENGVSYKTGIFSADDISADDAPYYGQYFASLMAEDDSYEIYMEEQSVSLALDPGQYLAVMLMVDRNGNSLNRFAYTTFEVYEITDPTDDYNKWIGTWSISGLDFYDLLAEGVETPITFNGITISPNVPNVSYTVAHWESNVEPENEDNWDWDNTFGGYQPTFTANFDAGTGELQFLAETITGFTMSGTTYYLVFNDYWLYNDGDLIATAALSGDGTSAAVTSVNDCYTIGYYIIADGSDSPNLYIGQHQLILTDGTNVYPVKMTKTSSATLAPAVSVTRQSSTPVVKKARVVSFTADISAPAAFKALSENGLKAVKPVKPTKTLKPVQTIESMDLATRKISKTIKK